MNPAMLNDLALIKVRAKAALKSYEAALREFRKLQKDLQASEEWKRTERGWINGRRSPGGENVDVAARGRDRRDPPRWR